MAACGLDFGTSNTTLGIASPAGPALMALEDGAAAIPSAIFYGGEAAPRIGAAAIRSYLDGVDGRLLRSLKSVLGSSLIEETTQIGRSRVPFRDVIGHYLAAVKRRAEAARGVELTQVVHGRPVHFVDGDAAADRQAEAALGEIARSIGLAEISFQYEPIAAAFDYERQIGGEELALIADIGGGTSDFSIVRLGPRRHGRDERAQDILANDGVRVGGTDFDRQLSLGTVMPLFGYRSDMKRPGLKAPSSYFHDLATWSSINRLYEPRVRAEIRQVRREARQPELFGRLLQVVETRRGHTLAIEVEAAKIALSDGGAAAVDLDWVEPGLEAPLTLADLTGGTAALAEAIGACLRRCLGLAGLAAERIDAIFLTGGSTRLPHVRAAIVAGAPAARVVEGDTFGSVGTGLTIEAGRRYGLAA